MPKRAEEEAEAPATSAKATSDGTVTGQAGGPKTEDKVVMDKDGNVLLTLKHWQDVIGGKIFRTGLTDMLALAKNGGNVKGEACGLLTIRFVEETDPAEDRGSNGKKRKKKAAEKRWGHGKLICSSFASEQFWRGVVERCGFEDKAGTVRFPVVKARSDDPRPAFTVSVETGRWEWVGWVWQPRWGRGQSLRRAR